MALKDQLMEDLKSAMRDHDEIKKNTVTMIKAAILQVEKDKQITLDENQILEIISKEAKKRRESIEEFTNCGRQDLVEQTEKELETIKKYLPEALSAEELEQIVKDTIAEVGATCIKDMGKVMQAVKAKTTGRAYGKAINDIVKSLLQ